MDPGAEAVHGISLHELRGEPEWVAIAPRVSKIMRVADLIVAHNIDFDIPFVVSQLVEVKQDPGDADTFCTMEEGRQATAMGKVPNLGELCRAFRVTYEPEKAHSAAYDTDVMMDCFMKGVERGAFKPEILTREEIV